MNWQNPRLVLVLIALLFIGPLLLAVMMRSDWWDYTPADFSNKGILVQPPVHLGLPNAETPKWSVLYPFPGACDGDCRADVTGLRQLHLATGRKRDRVSIVLLAPKPVAQRTLRDLLDIYPEFVILADTHGRFSPVLLNLDPSRNAYENGGAYLLDPPGNIMLSYARGFDPNDIHQDLKRLLTWSKQEEQP